MKVSCLSFLVAIAMFGIALGQNGFGFNTGFGGVNGGGGSGSFGGGGIFGTLIFRKLPYFE